MKVMRSKRRSATISLMITVAMIFAVFSFSADPAAVYAESGETGITETAAEDVRSEDSESAAEDAGSLVLQAAVSVKNDGLCVSWSSVSGAKSYEIYRSYKADSGWTLIKKDVTSLSYNDADAASGRKAYYKVRALLADGSYTDYSNTASGIIYRVYIETGHGRGIDGVWDSGCRWGKYQEAKLMIPICQSMTKYLRQKGVYVYTDAFSGNNRNLKYTLAQVKKHDVSVLVNVHCDYKRAPKGTLPLYRYSDQKELAKCLNNGVHKYVKIKNRGLKKRKDLKTLNKTRGDCVACLFETGNIKKDNKILRKQYDAYGKGLAKGVCDYLGIDW